MPGLPTKPYVKRSRSSRQFESHLEYYGRWFVYVRADRRFHCSCYDPTTEGNVTDFCTECFGLKFVVNPERMKAFLSAPEKNGQILSTPFQEDLGSLDQFSGLIYIHHSCIPRQGDLIIDCEWDRPSSAIGNGGRVSTIMRTWKIAMVIPVIFNENASVDYYLAGLEQNNLEDNLLTPALRSRTLTTQPYPDTLKNSSYEAVHSLGYASRYYTP